MIGEMEITLIFRENLDILKSLLNGVENLKDVHDTDADGDRMEQIAQRLEVCHSILLKIYKINDIVEEILVFDNRLDID